MTNSRSIGSRNRLLAIAVAAAAVLGAGRVAEAGRKRVVVLDFEGPKSEKFHDDLVRLIKKTHTVVPTDKWNGAAEQLAAGAVSDKNVKKVARKLKIDAIVEGKIEKRRDEFIIRLKLRAGRSGELIGDSIDTKADGPRIDGRAQKDLKDELVGAIDNVESNHESSGDDEDDTPVKRAGKKDDDDKPPAKKAARADDDDDDKLPAKKPAKKATKKGDDDDDDKLPAKKTAKKPDKSDKSDKGDDEDDRPARRGFSKHLDDEHGNDKIGKTKKPEADDDDDKLPAKKPARAAAATRPDDDELPPRKPAGKPGTSDDPKLAAKEPAKKPAARSAASDDDDKLPPRKPAGKPGTSDDARRAKAKKVASRDDDDASTEAEATMAPLDAATALSPGERFLDATLGMSMTMRRMTFAYKATLRATPPGYKGIPAPGALVDVTAYPLALGHQRRDVYKDLGVEYLYDRVLKLSSKVNSPDGMTSTVYSTEESRWSIAAVYRHAFGSSPTAPTVLGSLGFGHQQFNIHGKVDIPDVKYSIIAPGAGIRFPVIRKLILAADAKLLLVTSKGMIQDPDQYGEASTFLKSFDVSIGADYLVTSNIFVRAVGRFEVIGYTFNGGASQTNARDGMPMTQDVTGAHDNYIGGMLSVGYVY